MDKRTYQNILLTYLHLPYRWGGDDPLQGMDCSGLAQEILSIFSLDPDGDQTAHGLYLHFRKAEHGTVSAAEPGALCFYGSEHLVTHIAICFDNGVVLEAGGGGSKTTSYDLAVKQNAFVRLRHYMRRKDLVAVIKPIGLDLS